MDLRARRKLLDTIDFYRAVRRREHALRAIDELIALDPTSHEGYVKRAFTLAGVDPEGSLAATRAALARAPNDPMALYLLADAAIDAGDLASAEGHLRQALAALPGAGPILASLARVVARQGRRAEALALMNDALAHDPESGDLVLALLDLLDWASDPDGIRLRVREVLRDDPRHALAYHKLAQLALEEQDYETARGWLREVLRLDPTYQLAQLALKTLELVSPDKQRESPRLAEMQRALDASARTRFGRPKHGLAQVTLEGLGKVAARHAEFLETLPAEVTWCRLSFGGEKFEFITQEVPRLGRQALLRRSALEGLHVPPIDLRYANLSFSEVTDCVWDGARFDGAVAVETRLRGGGFERCSFGRTDFSDARVDGVAFVECAMEGVDFERVELTGATFDRCAMDGAALSGTAFRRCVFREVDWSSVDVSRASFEDCDGGGPSPT
jgi:uncharacterized protein YjbI with pentapeptide repeats/Tfp pilus assembly protein PilF